MNQRLFGARFPNEKLIGGFWHASPVDSYSAGGVSLGIDIHQQSFMTPLAHSGGKVDRCCGFSNAALLIGDSDDLPHTCFLP